jgi:DNA-binding NarL/FixJ family response regulator
MTITVLLADDQAMVREGFGVLLGAQPDIEVVGAAENGEVAVRRAAELAPDVVLMDVRMPVMDGLAATRLITAADPAPKVLVLTTFDLDDYVYEALRAGASGFLLKDASPEQLIAAIHLVAEGEAVLAPTVTRRVVEAFARIPAADDALRGALESLTAREREVLRLLARGRSNAEIARELFVSEATAKTHVRHVLSKLDLRDRVQAVVFAYESGLVRAGDGE